jgi:hypothetical protein
MQLLNQVNRCMTTMPTYTYYGKGNGAVPKDVKRVNIHSSVTTIGICAFYLCTSLTSVVIPNGVTEIGDYAFGCCTSLTSVVIPNGVTSIGNYAFGCCTSLTSVVIPNGVTSIGGSAFFDCTSLTSVVIPNGVTSIGGCAFQGCRSLAYIEIPEGITVGWFVFWGGPAGRKIKTIQVKVEPEPCTSIRSIDTPKSIQVKEEPEPSQFFVKLFCRERKQGTDSSSSLCGDIGLRIPLLDDTP